MFPLIFSILLFVVLLSKYYDWIIFKTKPDFRTILWMVLGTLLVITVFLEKIFHITI